MSALNHFALLLLKCLKIPIINDYSTRIKNHLKLTILKSGRECNISKLSLYYALCLKFWKS